MIFPSYIFLLAFLPVMLIVWHSLRSARWKLFFLTTMSYLFYGWWDERFVLLMFASTLLDFFCGLGIERATYCDDADPRVREARRRFWLVLSIGGNLLSLGFFKYYNFFAESATAALSWLGVSISPPVLNVILPLGISFYTFQSMSYTLGVFRGENRATHSFLRFAAYVSMFPQLVAGPIVRYREIEDQMEQLDHAAIDSGRMCDGIWLFVIGLIKKIWIADTLAPVVNHVFDGTAGGAQAVGPLSAWTGAICFALQLYFDFSGYSDMARGLGWMLGFSYPVNFDSPYKAASPAEFWRRWHISLSSFLRDYLYIPLGGSRFGRSLMLRNLAIVMLLGGLWHGAAWTFVVWGAYHGVLLIVHACWRSWGIMKIPRPVGTAATFLAIVVGWVFFRAGTLDDAFGMLRTMFGLGGGDAWTYYSYSLGRNMPDIYGLYGGMHGVMVLLGILAIVFAMRNSQALPKPRAVPAAVILVALVMASMLTLAEETPFLYFQF